MNLRINVNRPSSRDCQQCKKRTSDYVWLEEGAFFVCSKCYEVKQCKKCKHYFVNRCQCLDMDEWDRKTYHGHNYVPPAFPVYSCSRLDKSTPVGIEFELEIMDGNLEKLKFTMIDKVLSKYEWLYMVHDGSMRDDQGKLMGLEITTLPLTLRYWEKVIDELIKTFSSIKGLRSRFSTRTATHINIDCTKFSEQTIYQLYEFMYLNEEFIRYISEKPSGRFDKYSPILAPEAYKLAIYEGRTKSHHVALAYKRNRLEFRIFQGNIYNVEKSLEFVVGLINYIEQDGIMDDYNMFIDYVYRNKDMYNKLYEYFKVF